ncbi:hypothetical protein NMY22_g18778 [Coprinellus aureogranulatus]|nr:hypothetical protein NMY22_g18778 [Coprinellus aureogranulatus]
MTHVEEHHGTSVPSIHAKDNVWSRNLGETRLAESKAILAYFLTNCLTAMLGIFDEVALNAVLAHYPAYNKFLPSARFADTTFTNSYELMASSPEEPPFPSTKSCQLNHVKFACVKCGAVHGPFDQDASKEVNISLSCESKTVERNYQKITLQESPVAQLPRFSTRRSIASASRGRLALGPLINSAKPVQLFHFHSLAGSNGDLAQQLERFAQLKSGFSVLLEVTEASHINKKEDLLAAFKLTEEYKKQMRSRSLAQNERIKSELSSLLFLNPRRYQDCCGVPKDINHKHRIRGDINVPMLGDPGTGRSQFLNHVEKTARRSVFATGPGASAVGLTASVRKDHTNDTDRTTIHEIMEQQSISISKAGIVATLQARHPKFDKDTKETDVATYIDEDLIPQDVLRKYIMYAVVVGSCFVDGQYLSTVSIDQPRGRPTLNTTLHHTIIACYNVLPGGSTRSSITALPTIKSRQGASWSRGSSPRRSSTRRHRQDAQHRTVHHLQTTLDNLRRRTSKFPNNTPIHDSGFRKQALLITKQHDIGEDHCGQLVLVHGYLFRLHDQLSNLMFPNCVNGYRPVHQQPSRSSSPGSTLSNSRSSSYGSLVSDSAMPKSASADPTKDGESG